MILMSYKSYSLRKELVEELERLGNDSNMGFSSTADAIHWAIRMGCDKLRFLLMNRKNIEIAEGSA